MTGCIKLLKDGQPLQPDSELPELGYKYNQPAEHDQVCGTYVLHDFQEYLMVNAQNNLCAMHLPKIKSLFNFLNAL